MGHIDVKGLKDVTTGLDWDDSRSSHCRICALANIKRLPFPKATLTHAERPLYRIHTDICSKLPLGYGGYYYFVLFIDDYSCYMFIYFLKRRSDVLKVFIEFRTATEKFLGVSIVFLRCDNAPEYIRGMFENYCKTNGISYEKIVPDASPQNGVSEHANWTVGSMSRAMLLDGDMSDFFWPFAALTAVHIKVRVPHSAIPSEKTPFELIMHKKPDLSHLRPFGCLVTSRRLNSNTLTKFEPRGKEGRFLGYAQDSKGYLIWFPVSRTVLVRCDVIFHGLPDVKSEPLICSGPLWDDIPVDETTQFGSPTHREGVIQGFDPPQVYVTHCIASIS